MNKKKFLKKVLTNKQNVSFNDFKNLVEGFGFSLDRVKGSYHIFINRGVKELINIQNVKGQAKPYQISQFLSLVEKYNLSLKD